MAHSRTVRLRLRSRIRAGGMLEIRTPTPLPEGDVEVELHIRPTEAVLLPRGTPGTEIAQLAGILPDEDAEQMLRAIEEGCERIDPDEW